MGISIAMQRSTDQPATAVFDTLTDLRSWDDYAGVALRGPAGTIAVGDRIDAAIGVAGRTLRCGFRVESLEAPFGELPGSVVMRSVDGPVDGELHGVVVPTDAGCAVRVEVRAHGRGATRLIERPLELLATHWAEHQLRHLVSRVATLV